MLELADRTSFTDRSTQWCLNVSVSTGSQYLSSKKQMWLILTELSILSVFRQPLWPLTPLCLQSVHMLSIPLSCMSSLRSWTINSSCFCALSIKWTASFAPRKPRLYSLIFRCNEITLQLQGHSWVGSEQFLPFVSHRACPRRFSGNWGYKTEGWWKDDGCYGNITSSQIRTRAKTLKLILLVYRSAVSLRSKRKIHISPVHYTTHTN